LLFRTERQILRLRSSQHRPHVGWRITAQVAVLVMEYIDGIALDEYCHRQKLSLDARCASSAPCARPSTTPIATW